MPPKPSPRKRSKTYITETKTYVKNLAKWDAAQRFCQDNGFIFKLVTERELWL
jgi:hypothetical protein